MNDDRLTHLLGEKDRLQVAMVPLTERLGRCDAALSAMDRAQQCRDQLLAEHDRVVADAIADGRSPPEMNPALNLAEIALRKASGEARAAAMARTGIIEEIAGINRQLSVAVLELEEAIWLTVPRACAAMFEDVDDLQRRRDRVLAQIDSVAIHAYETAHRERANGPPETHPAYRAWLWFREALGALTGAAGSNVTRDFRTGKEIVAAVSRNEASLGDVGRWSPPSRALPDGSVHINRGEPPAQPVGAELPDPALTTAEGDPRAPAAAPSISGTILPDWLESSTPTFMPAPRVE